MVLDPPWLSRPLACIWSRELHMNINDINLTAWCLEQSLYNLNVFVLYQIKEFVFTFFFHSMKWNNEMSCYLLMTTIIIAFLNDLFNDDISLSQISTRLWLGAFCPLVSWVLMIFFSLFMISDFIVKGKKKKRKKEEKLSQTCLKHLCDFVCHNWYNNNDNNNDNSYDWKKKK